jgi:hypothetical protein
LIGHVLLLLLKEELVGDILEGSAELADSRHLVQGLGVAHGHVLVIVVSLLLMLLGVVRVLRHRLGSHAMDLLDLLNLALD